MHSTRMAILSVCFLRRYSSLDCALISQRSRSIFGAAVLEPRYRVWNPLDGQVIVLHLSPHLNLECSSWCTHRLNLLRSTVPERRWDRISAYRDEGAARFAVHEQLKELLTQRNSCLIPQHGREAPE
ncbi:hypothetical protein BDR03DRAFT_943523 [Suillus americanus]|nr:hypothetical protein BDR03DRAFT_943523 [Suillus americanus]